MKRIARHLFRHAKNQLIPHAGNGHVPHLLHHRALFGLGVFSILLKLLVIAIPVALPSSSLHSSAITANNIVSLTNGSRASLGLKELKTNRLLEKAAAEKAADMLKNGYFAHVSPGGLTVWSLIKKAGYRYKLAGENLAIHFESAEAVNDGWLASPSHRANIVNPRFAEIGVGVAIGEFDGHPSTLVVQVFGEPLNPASLASTGTTTAGKDVAGASVVPGPDGHEIAIRHPEAASAFVQAGGETVPLARTIDGALKAVIDGRTASKAGETVTLVATMQDGRTETGSVALLVPEAAPKNVYAFANGAAPRVEVLGISIEGLDDGVRRFYLYAVLFLIGLTMISVLAKFHMKRLPTVAHVMILALLGIGLMIA